MELKVKTKKQTINSGDIIVTELGNRLIVRYCDMFYTVNLNGEILKSFRSLQEIKKYYNITEVFKSSDLQITLKESRNE